MSAQIKGISVQFPFAPLFIRRPLNVIITTEMPQCGRSAVEWWTPQSASQALRWLERRSQKRSGGNRRLPIWEGPSKAPDVKKRASLLEQDGQSGWTTTWGGKDNQSRTAVLHYFIPQGKSGSNSLSFPTYTNIEGDNGGRGGVSGRTGPKGESERRQSTLTDSLISPC